MYCFMLEAIVTKFSNHVLYVVLIVFVQYYCEISPQRKCEIFPQRKQTGEKVESEPEGSMSVDCSVTPATTIGWHSIDSFTPS